MQLASLLNSIKVVQVTGEISDKSITGIFYDSRKVIKNSVFVAIKGFKSDGHLFIYDAINNGAIAVVLEDFNSVSDESITRQSAAKILVHDSRKALAELSDVFFDSPSRKIKLVGITGTNGKTTSSYFLKSIFESGGFKTGLIGTIANYIGDEEIQTSLTTPESSEINHLLNDMYLQGCTHAVMEVSSHSLALNRVHKLFFSAAIFTNLTQDHLDFHQNFDEYFKSKKILFNSLDSSAYAVYNADDSYGIKIAADTKAESFSYGISSNSDFRISNIHYDLSGTSFIIHHNKQTFKVSTALVGEFNAYNACSAFSAASLMGFEPSVIINGISKTKQVPGRFEVIGSQARKVIVDYSHTPDSLEKALTAIRKLTGKNIPVYAVFGCGGNRDRTKRPLMGKIASEIADHVIITSDNPRFEDPILIIKEIEKGISKKNYTIVENREEAIANAIKSSSENAVILIAGKGHENYQEINGRRHHFSDREIAEKYLNQ